MDEFAPDLVDTLQPGATEEQIARVEAHFSVRLPRALTALYRIHNGQVAHAEAIMDNGELLSLERMREEWDSLQCLPGDPQAGDSAGAADDLAQAQARQKREWNPRWIPITSDGRGNYDFMDFSSPAGGQAGQIMAWWHEDAHTEIVAKSFTAWFTSFIREMEMVRDLPSGEFGDFGEVGEPGEYDEPIEPTVDVKAWLKEDLHPKPKPRWPFGEDLGVK